MKQPTGVKNEDQLDELLEEHSFRAKRRDWVHTWDTDYETQELDMTERQEHHYKEMEDEFITWLESGDVISVDQAVTKRMKMQQISSGFVYDELRVPHQIMEFMSPPRNLWTCATDLEDRDTVGKGCDSVRTTGILQSALLDRLARLSGMMCVLLVGQQQAREFGVDVEDEKAKFNNGARILIAQSTAAKYGHNLMGSESSPCLGRCVLSRTHTLSTLDPKSNNARKESGR